MLDKKSLDEAFRGCEGVFHTASPITDDPEEMVEPAVNGARNMINAAADAGTVRRVVFTSSIGAVYMDFRHGPSEEVDETCWSDLDYCKKTKNWYCFGKTVAEKTAWELAKERSLDLVVLNPSLTYADAAQAYVHVRDVAAAHARVYEAPDASGRYLCAGSTLHRGELCRILAKLFPEYPVPNKCKGGTPETNKGCRFSSRRLTELGVGITPATTTRVYLSALRGRLGFPFLHSRRRHPRIPLSAREGDPPPAYLSARRHTHQSSGD
ncbi:hypothetical protein QOZ80_8BG0653440 [Eleusine coracana subsp. coracana]|nr:hypothetical protein QOZ80_8BG0653440 [Eleusine coracana subsp. coracana]